MFNTTRIISALVMIGAIIIIALIDQFLSILSFLRFYCIYLLVKQKTFALENISIIPLAIAFILGSLSHKALLLGF